MTEKNLGEQWDDFAAWVADWNARVRAPILTKDGRVRSRRKNPPDPMAVVRRFDLPVSAWDTHAKARAVARLLEEEENKKRYEETRRG